MVVINEVLHDYNYAWDYNRNLMETIVKRLLVSYSQLSLQKFYGDEDGGIIYAMTIVALKK